MTKNAWEPSHNQDDIELIEEVPHFTGKYLKFINFKVRFKTFAGEWSNTVDRYILKKFHASAILLFNPIEDYIVLVEQFRIGAFHAKANPWILEPVAGLIENNETPDSTAIKESKEEAGCEVVNLIPICNYLASPGTTNEKTYLYCGKITKCEGGIHGLPEENEDIKVHKIPTNSAFEMVKNGEIISPSAIISIQWLRLNYDNIKKNWL